MPRITTDSVERLVASGFHRDLAKLLVQHSRTISLPKGRWLFREGDVCDSFIMVIRGCLRVQKGTPDGHEIALYRVAQGQECNLTNTCLLGGHQYSAESVAEVDSEVLLLSRSNFLQLLEQQPRFRSLIFRDVAHGMSGLLDLVQEVAFEQMDHRLAVTLIKLSHGDVVVKATHKALATDLGTAREVISRLLKEFERHGWIKLHRGMIEIIDRRGLENFSHLV